MKLLALIMIMLALSSPGHSQDGRGNDGKLIPKEEITKDGITISVFDFEGLKPMLSNSSDTTYVINFWATWCRPCVEEMPHFIRLSEELNSEMVKFIFISLDFRKNLESGVFPFIKSRGIKDRVVMLHDPDADRWIPQVWSGWSGAIPATLVFKGERRSFYEKVLHYDELKAIIQSFNQ